MRNGSVLRYYGVSVLRHLASRLNKIGERMSITKVRLRNTATPQHRNAVKLLVSSGVLFAAVGCHTDMWVQPKTAPLEDSSFYPDKSSARPLVAGTVARGHLEEDTAFYTGRDDSGKLVTSIPIKSLTPDQMKAFILRGQERFNIYCTPCHGQLGDGQGMISKRGLALRRPPANYHTDRLIKMPIGHFYDVMTHGYGVMFSYASRVEPQDRWAIAAYIRVLQHSEHANAGEYAAAQQKSSASAAPMGMETQ
jgi:mono/diheme cytochrome c family protein